MDQEQTKEVIKHDYVSATCNLTPWKSVARCSSAQARALVPIDLAKKLKVLPLMVVTTVQGELLTVLVREEHTPEDIKALSFVSGMPIQSETCDSDLLSRAIISAYSGECENMSVIAKKASASSCVRVETTNYESSDPVPELLNAIIERAMADAASDIHLEPAAACYRIRMRKDGELTDKSELHLTKAVAEALCRRIKILAALDSTNSRTAQDGGFSFNRNGYEIRIRVSIVPMFQGEKVVLRLLDNYFLSSLKTTGRTEQCFSLMGLDDEQETMLKAHLQRGRGSIIVSGATGSGKSTLLYGCLEYLNNGALNITSIEDPVERIIPGINQAEICQREEKVYQKLLPNILRQDPDVIMIGEIRDHETAITALTAGITGHLLLSTVHAGNCIEALIRLLELKVEAKLIATSLSMLIAQKLIRKNCPYCLKFQEPRKQVAAFFHLPASAQLAFSCGCDKCDNKGYSGRQGVFELLPLNDQLREILFGLSKRNENDFLQTFRKALSGTKYKPFIFKIRELMLQGKISEKTALKTLGFDAVL